MFAKYLQIYSISTKQSILYSESES